MAEMLLLHSLNLETRIATISPYLILMLLVVKPCK